MQLAFADDGSLAGNISVPDARLSTNIVTFSGGLGSLPSSTATNAYNLVATNGQVLGYAVSTLIVIPTNYVGNTNFAYGYGFGDTKYNVTFSYVSGTCCGATLFSNSANHAYMVYDSGNFQWNLGNDDYDGYGNVTGSPFDLAVTNNLTWEFSYDANPQVGIVLLGTNSIAYITNTVWSFYLYGTATNALNANHATSAAGLDGTLPISSGGTGANTARGAGDTIGVYQMSSAGGHNIIDDMQTVTPNYYGQPGLALSANEAALYFSVITNGAGTNTWGLPISFPGGFHSIGNPIWRDIPLAPYEAMNFYMGMGPQASTHTNAWPNGQGGGHGSYQPYFQFINANPWGGGAGINIRSGFTNSSHGFLAGTNADGVPIYVSQFGFQLQEISDAYSVDGTAAGAECQQAPSHNILNSDSMVDTYFALNANRPGDSLLGQVPEFAISSVGWPTTLWAGFPYQVPNVWMVRNTNWQWALGVEEVSGAVTIPRKLTVGTVSSTNFTGNGGGLTNLPANAIAGGLTTNLAVLVPGGGTNMLCFTNGILRAVQ
jgi:hypothetical protein